jgi:hypothetical protein
MTPQDRVAKLESLLERVRRNAGKARVHAGVPAPVHAGAPVPAVASHPPAPAFVPEPLQSAPPVELEPTTLPPVPPPSEPTPVVVTPPPAWAAEAPSAVQARPASLPPEELSDDDLLDVTTLPPVAVAEAPAASEPPPDVTVSVEPEAEDEEEQAPVSSRRSKVAETLDEALASATELEEEREVPVKTPPPESGPQEAAVPLPPLEAAGVPDVDGLEADMLGPPSMGPTAEQLGETIELDEPTGPELEIDVVASVASVPEPELPPEELEITLPRAPMPSGTYDVSINPPLDVEVTGSAELSMPPVELPKEQEFVPTVPAAAHGVSDEVTAERTARPQHGATDVARVVLSPSGPPKNFVELLDISLGL